MSQVIEQIRVNGIGLTAMIKDQVTEGRLKLSADNVSSFDFTIQDQNDLSLTREAAKVFGEGAVIQWNDYALGLTEFTTGGDKAPTIEVSAESDFVRALKDQTGGKNWGTTEVSTWARSVITSAGANALVQPNLGEREIERKEDPGDHTDPETTWDVLAEMAKQTGTWVFEYGDTIIMGKPSWLIAQYGTRRYNIEWNTWNDHTDSLTAAPQYAWNKKAKEWEGRERLTIKAIDAGEGSFNTLSMCRPGDIVNFSGAAAITDDPQWLVREVVHPIYIGAPVTITAWRAVDPPEIIPKDDKAETGEGGSAGVPSGPIGDNGWQGEQLVNATEIVKEGQARGLPTLAMELAVATSMGETSLLNKGYGDAAGPDSTGLFQQRDTWGSRADRNTPSKAAGFYYSALVKQPYESNYKNGANSLAASNIGVVFIGPGSSANSASVTIHRVQINADPYHYAKYWKDAQEVVKACIAAGEAKNSGGGGKASGPLGSRIDQLMKSYEMRSIDVDGAFGAQCYDLAQKYVTDLKGIGMIRANGKDFWRHEGLMTGFSPIDRGRPPQKGDVVSWSGSSGPYANGGFGHVAIYSHTHNGTDFFLSQNPGPSRVQPLSRLGVLGWMRPKG